MAKQFQPTNKRNECQVCGDTSGKCRTTDTELVLCMNVLDAASTPNGWKFLRLSKGGGQWGCLVPSSQPESGNDRALRQQRAAERAAVAAARLARLEPSQSRDSKYRYQVANCPISKADLADLTRRRLTVHDRTELSPINDGRGGYIIPIRDRDGLMVGGQRRLDNGAKGSRYRWATTGENQLPDTGELPLAHWSGSDGVKVIALVEGTGIKPYLAAKQLNALAIGAAGGNFASSPQTLKLTLDRYSDLPVILVPDAGAVHNAGVMRQYHRAYKLLMEWGRELKILWWGQESKQEKGSKKPKTDTEKDIDEIDSSLFTTEIDWDEFAAIAYRLLGKEFLLTENRISSDSNLESSEKPKTPPALAISKKVFADLFSNKIRFDGSVKQYWRYDGKGKWVVCSDEYIFGRVQEYLEETIGIEVFTPSYVRNVIEFARKDFLHEGWTEASSLAYIPFTNGVLELAADKLLPHSPDYGFTWQLSRPYSASDAGWGDIDKFLISFCGDNGQLKDIAIAFCNAVIKGRADLQKFLYLFGSGANGKGAFMLLLTMLVGQENTHSTTMSELNDSRFESANLKGKRLVLMTDEDRRVGGFGIFKAATGQDSIRYERKGKDASNFIFKGIFVVAANAPTFVGESNPALKRRKVDFPCLARIAESDRRDLTPEFDADLTAFTTYLLSLPDKWVTETIRGASMVEAVKNLGWEMAVREDSIASFYEECLIADRKGMIQSTELYQKYKEHCEAFGLKPKGQRTFTPSLLDLCNISLGYSVKTEHKRQGTIWFGIRFRQPEDYFEKHTSDTTQKKLSASQEINFSPESKEVSHVSPSLYSKGLSSVTYPSPSVTSVTDRLDIPGVEASF
jgi:P4 family phage/plasmid primase-like protien